ncbi:DNA-binding protein [Stutzerimonas frequens]|uniref:DNA-binding protein n=1 Tax=Stutzerimonas frequens TaxID=2968969 RepID=UPI0021093899|nr:DNA-binding protein [Stutzerimonas frequens]MCQ4306349.1 DNA-binding protein [Stutzerimonas frequens]
MFVIPAATSITSLFVIKKDHYTNKDTGEVRANIQALSPIPAGSNGNAEGFEVTEYAADAGCLDHIDLSQGPVALTFESQIRPITNRFGRTTNTQVLVKVVSSQPQQRPAQPQPQPPSKAPDAAKAN